MACERLILVVEDDPEIRSSLCDILSDEGYQVDSAVNGRDALVRLAAQRPCVILLDLMMPVMNGWEFLAELAKRPELAGIPVVVVSAYTRHQSTRGATAVVSKPIDVGKLFACVSDLCAREVKLQAPPPST